MPRPQSNGNTEPRTRQHLLAGLRPPTLAVGQPAELRSAPEIISRRSAPRPTKVFDTYWRFAAERQRIFFLRAKAEPPPWTDDPILQRYKFTNAYRASDRVSQYLIREVIYDAERDFVDTFLRIVLFKIFNRIETWQTLERAIGDLNVADFDPLRLGAVLEGELAAGRRIYSGAYIMPTGGRKQRKHRLHLELLASMVQDRLPNRIASCNSMEEAFEALLAYPSVGPFLAYQWVTDLNYAPHLNFDEMEFVMPGPGARDGIRKCFMDLGDWTEADLIRWVADKQEQQFEQLDIEFSSLWGRRLQLIDCQSLFCEVDKYARMKHPEVTGHSGRRRIKQLFRVDTRAIEYLYPPKWGLSGSGALRALHTRTV